jgi:ATP-dependent DNA helicase RecQ
MRGTRTVLQQVQKERKVTVSSTIFDQLRALRKKLATRDNVPPYMVFSDATLQDMCIRLPHILEEMRNVKGVGDMKLQKYGQTFLDCLNNGE